MLTLTFHDGDGALVQTWPVPTKDEAILHVRAYDDQFEDWLGMGRPALDETMQHLFDNYEGGDFYLEDEDGKTYWIGCEDTDYEVVEL